MSEDRSRYLPADMPDEAHAAVTDEDARQIAELAVEGVGRWLEDTSPVHEERVEDAMARFHEPVVAAPTPSGRDPSLRVALKDDLFATAADIPGRVVGEQVVAELADDEPVAGLIYGLEVGPARGTVTGYAPLIAFFGPPIETMHPRATAFDAALDHERLATALVQQADVWGRGEGDLPGREETRAIRAAFADVGRPFPAGASGNLDEATQTVVEELRLAPEDEQQAFLSDHYGMYFRGEGGRPDGPDDTGERGGLLLGMTVRTVDDALLSYAPALLAFPGPEESMPARAESLVDEVRSELGEHGDALLFGDDDPGGATDSASAGGKA